MTARTMPRATEAQCQSTIVAAAHAAGWWVHSEHTGMTARGAHLTRGDGRPGWPDLILLHPYHRLLWAIELKRRPNKPTAAQVEWLDQLAWWADRCDVIYVPDDMHTFCAELVNPVRREDSHMTHAQQCSCLDNSAECCRPRCECHTPLEQP